MGRHDDRAVLLAGFRCRLEPALEVVVRVAVGAVQNDEAAGDPIVTPQGVRPEDGQIDPFADLDAFRAEHVRGYARDRWPIVRVRSRCGRGGASREQKAEAESERDSARGSRLHDCAIHRSRSAAVSASINAPALSA